MCNQRRWHDRNIRWAIECMDEGEYDLAKEWFAQAHHNLFALRDLKTERDMLARELGYSLI